MEPDKRMVVDAYDILGRSVTTTFSEVFAYLRDWRTQVFIVLAIVTIVTTDVLKLRDSISFLACLLLWSLTVLVHVGAYVTASLLWAKIRNRYGLFKPYMPIFSIFAFSLSLPVNLGLFELLSGEPVTLGLSLKALATGAALILIFEALFFILAYPTIASGLAGETPDPPDTAAIDADVAEEPALRGLRAAGEFIPIAEILFLRSQEHYVQVVTANGEKLLRVRLGDLVSQTNEEDGVLAHRSYWVARSAIDRLISRNGTDQIRLSNGEMLPVARPRRGSVRDWMASYGPGTGTE